ncbi:7 transmembrane receptor [Oesophagostomum dentatum]|uniref:7 transmembrane receptor n=1 Tax=Oesophagostomum dentatum TaxID=61180 RepID=A0A0B1T1E4_OESDE|nr:7 transmembrane receptor [Oesophagostomum dentatum]
MALDRYLAVVYPVDSMTLRSPKNTIIALVVLYTIIMASQIPVGLMHGIYTYEFLIEERSTCAIVKIATNNATATFVRTYFTTFNVFGYILPLGISVVLYWRMLKRLWDTPRPGHGNSMNGSLRSRPENRRAKRKVTRLVLCVLVIWAFCWLPLNVCFFFSGLSYPETLVMKGGVIMVIVQIASQVLAYTNSCLNPILYALMSENFRKGFIRVICTIGRKLTMNTCCVEADKQMRLEFTTCNNNSTVTTSFRGFQTTKPKLWISDVPRLECSKACNEPNHVSSKGRKWSYSESLEKLSKLYITLNAASELKATNFKRRSNPLDTKRRVKIMRTTESSARALCSTTFP